MNPLKTSILYMQHPIGKYDFVFLMYQIVASSIDTKPACSNA